MSVTILFFSDIRSENSGHSCSKLLFVIGLCLFRFRQNKFWLLPVSSPLSRLFATRSRVAGDHASQTHPITPLKLLLRYFLTDSPSVSTTIWVFTYCKCRLVSSVLNPKFYYRYCRFSKSSLLNKMLPITKSYSVSSL
jgi:hypothetical protein